MTAKAYTLDIRLPEGVVFSLPLAGPVTRFLAWLIDAVSSVALATALSRLIIPLASIAPDAAGGVAVLLLFVVPIVYGIGFEAFWRGQTPGKRVMRLRVLDEGGLRLDLRQVVVRNLLRFVDMLPQFYLVGGIACLCSARAQRLGDLAAGTVVVRTAAAPHPDLTLLASDKYNTLRDHPALAARLRQQITLAEAELALQSLVRRNKLDALPRAALFAQLAARFRAAAPLPDAVTENLTDEQYVRNVADIVYRPKVSAAPTGAAART